VKSRTRRPLGGGRRRNLMQPIGDARYRTGAEGGVHRPRPAASEVRQPHGGTKPPGPADLRPDDRPVSRHHTAVPGACTTGCWRSALPSPACATACPDRRPAEREEEPPPVLIRNLSSRTESGTSSPVVPRRPAGWGKTGPDCGTAAAAPYGELELSSRVQPPAIIARDGPSASSNRPRLVPKHVPRASGA